MYVAIATVGALDVFVMNGDCHVTVLGCGHISSDYVPFEWLAAIFRMHVHSWV